MRSYLQEVSSACHRWLYQESVCVRARSFDISGDTICSYQTVIVRRCRRGQPDGRSDSYYIFNHSSYSPTTQTHQSLVQEELRQNRVPVVELTGLPRGTQLNLSFEEMHECFLEEWRSMNELVQTPTATCWALNYDVVHRQNWYRRFVVLCYLQGREVPAWAQFQDRIG